MGASAGFGGFKAHVGCERNWLKRIFEAYKMLQDFAWKQPWDAEKSIVFGCSGMSGSLSGHGKTVVDPLYFFFVSGR